MSTDFDRGPLRTYEVIWRSGHVETVQGHQVCTPNGGLYGSPPDTWFRIHGEIDGRWTLVLQAREEDILSVRLIPAAAEATGGAP